MSPFSSTSNSPPEPAQKPSGSEYGFKDARGWRRWRPLRPGWGMYHDVKRRLPYYYSDITDAFTYRTIASTVRMYFVNLLPALAYTLDMYRQTGQFYGVNEALFTSALAALIFSLLGAQPLTIVGITGLIALFNYKIYDIITQYDASIYPQFMCWTAIWAAMFHWIVAFCNLCDYMRYVTDFSSESFGMYVGIIYMIKGVEELVAEFSSHGLNAGYLSTIIAILYFGTVYALEKLGNSTLWTLALRGLLADYAYPLGTMFWVGFSHFPGNLKRTDVSYLPISKSFHPTANRLWLIHFWHLDVKWVFVALPFGFLLMLLFYYDHNISSISAQARQFPLKKPGGFHWDFLLLGCTTFVAGILGLPLPNGLVPQAPVHTDSLTVYKTDLLVLPNDEGEGAELRRSIVRAESVVEQRVSHLLMGLLLVGTMTRPLLVVLHTMPSAIFADVFFIVGNGIWWGSIESNTIVQKLIYLQSEDRFVPKDEPPREVSKRKIWLWLSLQGLGVAATVAISQTIAAIGFPVIIIALIPLRTHIVPKMFNKQDLEVLDDLTANNPCVLASLGGPPNLPEHIDLEQYGATKAYAGKQGGVPRQRAGSIHR
ncbi:hypothetical protein D6D01_03100 [Aureobasidium pullulans]|uniref:Bicarbonate transporter-like transmembrane domain-containing protein n=1 Tax=Aureobasidium pullulans TaxID=5580 RepID=A0A4S9LMA1_AURPU|nr:hypothetical protein D6D01_03100 [Aureobasidium pullulans]